MLHIINKSPFNNSALEECLRVCSDDAFILLIEDGVYAAIADTAWAKQLADRSAPVYVLTADIAARGLTERIATRFECIDYTGFVQLCCDHASIQSWY
jgi:tRNA 2-thiouridine synthesizing protein B